MMQNPQYYFGLPGDLIALPRPSKSMPLALSRSRVLHGLAGGGASVTMRARTRSRWQLAWPWLDELTAGGVLDYVDGAFGDGPFRFIDPMWRNVLPLNASVAGRQSGDPKAGAGSLPQWRPGGGDLLVLDAASPTAGPNRTSGVMRWTGAVAGDYLVLGKRDEASGAGLPIFDEPNELPAIPGETTTFSIYAKLLSGTSATVQPRLHGFDTTGAATVSAGTALALTASWQRLPHSYLFTGTSAYHRPVVGCTAAVGSPVIQLAAAQVEYGPAATVWASGSGLPRVVVEADPELTMEMLAFRSFGLTLREV